MYFYCVTIQIYPRDNHDIDDRVRSSNLNLEGQDSSPSRFNLIEQKSKLRKQFDVQSK